MARIVNRDVKASNILLDATLCPKVSDFGLAKLYDDNKTHFSTHNIAGTIEYLAPEYALWEQLTEKADVFGFGIVALEIVSGKPNFFNNHNNEETYLLDWLMKNNQIFELLVPSLAEFDETEATRASPTMRPPMSSVVSMLTGDMEVETATSKPSYLTDCDLRDIRSSVPNTEGTSSVSKDSSSFFSC